MSKYQEYAEKLIDFCDRKCSECQFLIGNNNCRIGYPYRWKYKPPKLNKEEITILKALKQLGTEEIRIIDRTIFGGKYNSEYVTAKISIINPKLFKNIDGTEIIDFLLEESDE